MDASDMIAASSLGSGSVDAPALAAEPAALPDTAQLRAWVAAAQPNARLVYGLGGVVAQSCRPRVRELVWELAEKGFVTPHRCKLANGEVGQIVQRTHRPLLKGERL